MTGKLYKPHRVSVSNGRIAMSGPFWRKAVDIDDIRAIKIEGTLSLVEELGITLSADVDYFFTDAQRGFAEIAAALNFDGIFGNEWYAKAEGGETLRYEA